LLIFGDGDGLDGGFFWKKGNLIKAYLGRRRHEVLSRGQSVRGRRVIGGLAFGEMEAQPWEIWRPNFRRDG